MAGHQGRKRVVARYDPVAVVDRGVPGQTIVTSPYLLGSAVYRTNSAVRWPLHRHRELELLWGLRGVVHVRAEQHFFAVAPGHAVLIPAEIEHDAETTGDAMFGCTYMTFHHLAGAPARASSLPVDPALRELLLYLNRQDLSRPERLRAQRVCLAMVIGTEPSDTGVPYPSDPRLRPMVHGLLSEPADARSVEQWGRTLSLNARTITRLLSAEIGMTFSQWRRLVRVRAAQSHLATGESVQRTGWRVGYTTTSAFVAAFRQMTGQTPRQYGATFPSSQEVTDPLPTPA